MNFASNGQKSMLISLSRPVTITGNNNDVTLVNCKTNIVLSGQNNTIRIETASQVQGKISGSANLILVGKGGNCHVKFELQGIDNKVEEVPDQPNNIIRINNPQEENLLEGLISQVRPLNATHQESRQYVGRNPERIYNYQRELERFNSNRPQTVSSILRVSARDPIQPQSIQQRQPSLPNILPPPPLELQINQSALSTSLLPPPPPIIISLNLPPPPPMISLNLPPPPPYSLLPPPPISQPFSLNQLLPTSPIIVSLMNLPPPPSYPLLPPPPISQPFSLNQLSPPPLSQLQRMPASLTSVTIATQHRNQVQRLSSEEDQEEEEEFQDYSQFLRLEEDQEEDESGLSVQAIKKLVKSPHQDRKIEESSLCTVCQYDIINDEMETYLACLHVFHSECIYSWLKKCSKCPLCNFNQRRHLKG